MNLFILYQFQCLFVFFHIITTWISCLWLDYNTIRTTVYSSFLHSQCLFVTEAVQGPVSGDLTLTPQVADMRTILVGSQHPEGVCLWEFPLNYQ